jgi:hypothetical protein
VPAIYLVTVESGGETASVVVRFVVERHPCLTVRPHPSFTWDPFTNTAKVKVSLWSCGNVDLDVSWSAHVDGRRLEVDPLKLTVFADGGPVDTTLTIKIPGGVDIDTQIDLESLSEDGAKRFTVVAGGAAPPEPRRSRRNLWRALASVAVAAIIVALLIVNALADDDEPTTISTATTAATEAATTAETEPTTIAPPVITTQPPTTGSTATTTAVPPPRLVVVGKQDFDINAAVGGSGEATFVIANGGGRDADVHVVPPDEGSPFSLKSGGCKGALEAKKECEVTVTFEPSRGETYPLEITVEERKTGASLSLSVTGRAGAVDLTVSLDEDPWSTTCPGRAAECLTFIVTNRGDAPWPPTFVEVSSGSRVVHANLASVEPNVSVVMTVVISKSCANDCSASVTVDSGDDVLESDETNNFVSWSEIG